MRQELYVSFNDIKDLSPLLAHEASKLAGWWVSSHDELPSSVRPVVTQSFMGDQLHSPLLKKIFLAALPAEYCSCCHLIFSWNYDIHTCTVYIYII